MIVDWYFTRCIGANPKQAMTFLRILECFDSSDDDVRTAAIEQLARVDDWMQLYALPRVLAAAADIPSQTALDAYYASVTEGRESASRLRDLIDAASRGTAQSCVNVFAKFAEGQRREAAGRSKIPYIDLREFADESIALAALRAAVTRQPEIRDAFKGAGNDSSALVLNSLTHDLGRMAFVEGVRLAHMLGLRSRDALLHLLEQHPDLITEPDLATTYVWIRFYDAEDDASDTVLALLRESVLLNDYRRLSAASNKSADVPAFPALRLIANSAMYRVVLWQLVLWATAADIEPETAASAFATFWIPPQQRDSRFEIGHPAENRRIQPWIKDFVQPIIAQRGYSNLILRTERDSSFSPKAGWWPVASPWLLIDPAGERRADPRTRYLRASPLNTLRLLGATAIATRLLLRRQVPEQALEALAALAVHAYDVLQVFVFGDGGDEEDARIRLHGDLEVLARFTHRQLSVLASGEAGVNPEVFVSLLDKEGLSEDERIFRTEVLPVVLVSFVADAIPLATQGSGAGQWMEQLTLCYPHMARAQARDRIEAQLLVRYLTRIDEDLEDWRRIAQDLPTNYWNIDAQCLLLPRECVAADWWAPDWPEPDAEHAAVLPVRLVQRFAASFSNDRTVPGKVTAAWRREFLEAIASMTSRPDDFLRLRLNEILFDPAIGATQEERTAIFSLLADWASPSDVERLANSLFPPSSPPARDSELRSLFVGIAIHEVEVLVAASTDATDPRSVLQSRKRAGVFRTALRRAALLAHRDSKYTSLKGILKAIANRSDERRTPSYYRGTFELVNEREIEMPPPRPGIARQIRSISRDPNRMTATLLYEEFDFDPALVIDLLHAKPGTAEQAIAAMPRPEVMGVIIDHDDKHLVIDCGLDAFVQGKPGPKVHIGSVVQAQLERRGNAWTASQVVPLVPRHEMSPTTWKLRWPKAGLPEVVHERTILNTSPSPAGRIDWNYWVPDIQIVFTRQGAFDAEVLAERLDSGEWRPVTRDVWRLISLYGPNVEAVVVSFDDEQLVLSPAPGSLYSIEASDLQESAAQQLRDLQKDFTDIRGLRLPLRAEVDAGGRLTVGLEDKACVDVNVRWRQLFDSMDALTARRQPGSVHMHSIEEPIPGFPVSVRVTFDPPQNDSEVDFVVDNPSAAWNPWRNEVRGTRTLFSEIEAKPHDRPRVVQSLLNVKHADRFQITKARGRVSDRGELLCLTPENLPFDVKAETLSFGSVGAASLGRVGREVEVTQIAQFSKIKFPGDDADVPREILDAGGGEGIIARAPRPKEPVKTYEIWWLCGTGVIEHELTIEGQAQYLGTRVTAAANSEGLEITVHPRRIKCDALWRQVEGNFPDGSLYLGVVGGKAAIEQLPGVFQLVSQSAARGKHLARWSNAAFIGGLTGRERATVQQLGAQNRKRAMVALSERATDDVVWGDTFDSGDLVSDVPISIVRATTAERFILKRRFVLTRRRVEVVAKRDDSALYQKMLDEYFANVRTLDVSVRPPATVMLSNLRVPEGNGKWKSTVNFGKDEGVWVGSARYRGTGARVQLIREREETIVASARAVPPLSLADYFDLLGADPNEEITLEQPLYYAGAAEREGFHRFEWDYGWTIVAHESELRFLNFKFRAARDLIFFGDAVRRISFIELPKDDENASPRYVLVLNDLSIAYSEATLIFMQRRKHKIVHLLRLKPKRIGDNIAGAEIASVMGLDDRSADMAHGFERTRAVLAAASEAMVVARLKLSEESESWKEPSIYGRLDETEFRRSLGKEVRFDLVEFTLNATRRHRLRSQELVFLMAGKGSPGRNDYRLAMRVPDGIHSEDVGDDAKGMRMLRRAFSVREEVLPRLMRRDPSSLAGQLFLVRPWFKETMLLSLWWRRKDTDELKAPPLPTRKGEVLQSLVEHTFVLATVIHADHRAIDVEYSPGIFIAIRIDQIEFASDDLLDELVEGSVIRIEKGTGAPYLVSRAAFADRRYLSEGLRTVVAFPKNDLLDRKKSEPWQIENQPWTKPRFPLGGMPDVLAAPGSFNVLTKAWGEPDAAQFREFMSRVHPKIGLAGPGDRGVVRLEPGRTKTYVGAIAVDPATREPRYKPDPVVGAPWTRGLKWPFLSFADAGVRTIEERLQRKWRYHDDETGVWREDGDIDPTPLRPHTGLTGPVMFDEGDGDLHLRYAANVLSRFGYPMRELVNYLGDRGESAWFAVAAVTPSSMWIEIAPGRVSELPFAQIVHADVPAASLQSLEWTLFAPGDWVQLRLASADPKTPDRVAIQQWVPSLRGAAGERMILPVVARDAEEGVLRLGAGDFQTDYPWLDNAVPPVVLLALGNRASRFEIRDMRRNDCALLALDSRGELCIAGCAGLTVQPSGAGWEGDPLSVWFKRVGAEELVRIAGGAIPITIEDIEGKRIFFSRGWQKGSSVLAAERMTVARVLGALDGNRMLMRSGSALFVGRADAVVSGLPHALAGAMAQTLHERNERVWIRGTGSGDVTLFGLADERTATIRAKAVAVASDGTSSGLACRSLTTQSLYWLPANDVAWTRLTGDELREVFVDRDFPFRAQLRPDEAGREVLSITRTPDAIAELRALHVDDELSVKVIRKRGGAGGTSQFYLVSTYGSGIVMVCRIDDSEQSGELQADTDLRVEVIRRFIAHPPVVSVTKVGTRRPELDVPAWMLTEAATSAIPSTMRRTMEWVNAGSITPRRNLGSAPDAMIDQAVAEAWGCLSQGLDPQVGLSIAEAWCLASGRREEIELSHALMCIVLLRRLSTAYSIRQEEQRTKQKEKQPNVADVFVRDWNEFAGDLLAQIAARALRSLHSEILSARWLKTNRLEEPTRMILLRSSFQQPVTTTSLSAIRQFCRSAELRDWASKNVPRIVADGCRRAIGEAEIDDRFHGEAQLLDRVIRLGDAYTAPLRPNRKLHSAYFDEVESLLGQIVANRISVTLMRAIEIREV
jgi:hypothetical protein